MASHHTKSFGDAGADPGARFYYEVRNKLWVYTRSAALTPWEKVLYSGASVRNWTRTIAGSPNKRLLLNGFLRGLLHGMKAPAATNRYSAGSIRSATCG